MASDVPVELRREVAERAFHVCEYCLIHEDDSFWGCQVDHVVSRKHGGLSVTGNLAWACACCNSAKGTDLGTLAGFPRQLTRLFHPRTDRWGDFFSITKVRIDPQNSIAEGTINLLRINDPPRLRERAALAEVGRYPSIEALARMKD